MRLVDADTTLLGAFDSDSAQACIAGLRGAYALAATFPDFYAAEQVAQMPATTGTLLGCCGALWHLADERAGFPFLRWPDDGTGDEMGPADTPAETLRGFGWASIDWMATVVGEFVACPRPHYWGWGVESALEEWGDVNHDPVTLLLWHMFQHTEWAIGVDVASLREELDEELYLTIGGVRPLPTGVPLHLLAQHLVIPQATKAGVPVHELLAYAFGQCTNELANHTDYEIEAIHFGGIDYGWSWGELGHVIALAREARQLAAVYEGWSLDIKLAGEAGLRRLAAQIWRAARAARAEAAAAPRGLLALVGHPLAPIGTDLDAIRAEEALATL